MRFASDRPFANPDVAARRLVEIANDIEPVQDGLFRLPEMHVALQDNAGTSA
jgi:hypothetical protein